MKIWHYDPRSGVLLGSDTADADPVVSGNWLVPAFATAIAPPEASDTAVAVFTGSGWQLADAGSEDNAPGTELGLVDGTGLTVDEVRRRAYAGESDPLYIEWQFLKETGGADADAAKARWIAAVQEIKARHPK